MVCLLQNRSVDINAYSLNGSESGQLHGNRPEQKGCVVTLIGDPSAVLHQGNVQSVVSPTDLLVRASVMRPARGTLGLSMLGG